MYNKIIISTVIIVLVILILLILVTDTKKRITNDIPIVAPDVPSSITTVPVIPSVPASNLSIETITITKQIVRLDSKAMNLQLNVNINVPPTVLAMPFVNLTIPPLPNSTGRLISITNVANGETLRVIAERVSVIFPNTTILPGQTVRFKAVRENEYVVV